MFNEYIPLLNFMLNLLILPLLAILWQLKAEIVKLNQWLISHESRLVRIESALDKK